MPEKQCYFVDGSENIEEGLGPIMRHNSAKNGLVKQYWDNCTTMYDLFQHGVSNHPNEICLGQRNNNNGVLDDHFSWKTYIEVSEEVNALGYSLLHHNLVNPIAYGDHKTTDGSNYKLIGIYCRNKIEWVVSEYAIFSVSGTILPLYDTFNTEALCHIFKETGLETVICTLNELKSINIILNDHNDPLIKLKNLIIIDYEKNNKLLESIEKHNIIIYDYNNMIKLGKENKFVPILPNELDPAYIFYTSGATGTPKGVITLHQNLASVSQSGLSFHPSIYFPPGHFYLSYLPLPHVFEQFIHGIILSSGGAIGFYSGDKNKLLEDIKILRPTVFASVPRILTRMKDNILDNIYKSNFIKYYLFNWAINRKLYYLKYNYYTDFISDTLIFNKIRAMIGFDRLQVAITGSAPITPDTLAFMRCLLCVPIMQGFGMTEASGGLCVTWPGDITTPSDCGNVIPGSEVRLVSVHSKGYSISDKYHGRIEEDGKVIEEGIPCLGRGELVFRGYNRTPGYFRRPDMTSDTIDKDGWLHTGDIAMITPDYKVQIVDRIKNIIKLSQGEYVAVENLENLYQLSQYIDQIYIYGDSYKNCLVAIIVPDKGSSIEWAKSNNFSDFSLGSICGSKEFKQLILGEINEIVKSKKLNGIEKIRNIFLEPKSFSLDDGLLTPTMKLKRHDLQVKYSNIIDELYQSINE